MKNTNHKYLIILLIIVLFGSIYAYFVSDLKSEAASPVSVNSDLSSNIVKDPALPSDASSSLTNDVAFLSTLTSLKKIKIDLTIFNNQAFQALNYNVVTVDPVNPGRVNPFSPVSGFVGTVNTVTSSLIKTN